MSNEDRVRVVFNKNEDDLDFTPNGDEAVVDTGRTSYNAINAGAIIHTSGGRLMSSPEEPIVASSMVPTSSSITSDVTDKTSSSNIIMLELSPEESSPLRETTQDPFARSKWIRYLNGLYLIILSMITFAVIITIVLIIQIKSGVTQVMPHGAVTSSNNACSKLGVEIMRDVSGSSTMDAVVLSALCLSVLHPHSGGIGGGGYMIVHNLRSHKNATGHFNFRELSPSQKNFGDNFNGKNATSIPSGLRVGVPGLLKGLKEAHSRYGRLPWSDLVMRAHDIAVATDNQVSDELATAIDELGDDKSTKSIDYLIKNKGKKLKKGDTLPSQTKLANLLKEVSSSGVEAFYKGQVATEMVNVVKSANGSISKSDVAAYEHLYSRNDTDSMFGNMKVITGIDSWFGSTVRYVINLLESLQQDSDNKVTDNLKMHRLVEALKFGIGKLPLGVNTISGTLNENKKTASINDKKTFPSEHYLNGFEPLQFKSNRRQFVTALGPDYVAVSLSMSLGSSFGSRLVSSGVVLNDAMMDFSWEGKDENPKLPPSKVNMVKANTRPASPLLPIITVPKKSKCGNYMVIGDGGNESTSLPATVRVLLELSKNDDNLQKSIQLPRLFPDLMEEQLRLEEENFPEQLETFLKGLGHNITKVKTSGSSVCGIARYQSNLLKVVLDHRSNHSASDTIF